MELRCSLVILAASVVGSPASANPIPPLDLSAHAHGSAFEVVLRNWGTSTLTIPINSVGYDDHLSIQLTGSDGKVRDFVFKEPRDKPVERSVTLAPKATYTETIDLVSGALRGNVDPPPPGTYRATLFWSDRRRGGGFETAVDAAITIPAPVEGPCTSKATAGVEMLGRQVAADGSIEIGLHNTSASPICVVARIDASGPQSDWLSVELRDGLGARVRTLGFVGPRRDPHRITVDLAPGATTWTRWDLAAWAKLAGSPLAHGLVYLTAAYDSSAETTVFRGRLSATFALNVR